MGLVSIMNNINFVFNVILITVPAPSTVNVTSNKVNPIRPVGSDITLTCTVELSPAVDVPVTVNTVWIGPAGVITTNTAQPIMESNTTYVSTAVVRSFGRTQSGNYTCRAALTFESSFVEASPKSGIAFITTGIYNKQSI